MTTKLVDIPTESLVVLRDYYKVNWPEHLIVYNFLDKMYKRFKKSPEMSNIVKFFSINGEINNDATFIALGSQDEIIVGTLDLNFNKLNIGLKSLDFSKKRMFLCLREIYYENIINFIQDLNLNKLFDDATVMVYISNEDARKLKFEIPEGISARRLSLEDAEKVNKLWTFKSDESLDFIKYVVETNISVGLYDKESGELLAWCLEHDHTALLTLQVDPNHLRKGYGSIVAKAITKQIAEERGLDVFTHIVVSNDKSKNLFNKIGYKIIDKNYWISAVNK